MESIDKGWVFSRIAGKFFKGSLLYFTLPLIVFFLIGAILILVLKRGDIVLALNSVSNKWFDQFFLVITNIGLGSSIAGIGVLMMFYKFRWSLLVFINLAWVGLFTNFFKRIFFNQLPRPMHYFYYDDFSRFLYDAPISYFNTFPSGHTMTIYAFCSLTAFLLGRKAISLILFVLAFIVGFSRIYLLQHFFIDTYFGAILGIVSTILTIWLDQKFKLSQNRFLDRNLLNFGWKKKYR